MGAGKTTIGKILKKITKIPLVDTDLEIEKLSKMKIDFIFEKYGEKYFRKLETKILKKLYLKTPLIISIGGGTITVKKNLELIKKNSIIIFLNTPLEICLNRIENKKTRPLLKKSEKEIKALFEKRQKIYSNVADFTVNNNYTQKNCVKKILQIFSNFPNNFY